jgi:hypothetical protein
MVALSIQAIDLPTTHITEFVAYKQELTLRLQQAKKSCLLIDSFL